MGSRFSAFLNFFAISLNCCPFLACNVNFEAPCHIGPVANLCLGSSGYNEWLPGRYHYHLSSPSWYSTSSSSWWVLISVVVAVVALASLPDGAGAHAIRRGHPSSTGEGRQRSLAALALATYGDALPRVHFRSRLGSRRAKHYRRRAPRNLNTCGNEPEGTTVSELDTLPIRVPAES